MWSKNCANACVKTAMTHGSSTIRSRPCPPASMNWPCINPLPSSTTCTITAPAASTEYFTGTERPAFPAKAATISPGIMHACWRKNAAYSSLAAAVLHQTRRMGAWSRFSSYIAISRRQRELLIQTGIPEDKIRVIPHFIRQNPAPFAGPPRRDVLYAGRLTQEKRSPATGSGVGTPIPPRPHSLPDGETAPCAENWSVISLPAILNPSA